MACSRAIVPLVSMVFLGSFGLQILNVEKRFEVKHWVLRCVVLPFFVSGVGAGVGPCVFGCWRALLSSLALFGGLPLDPDYAVPDAKKQIIHFLTVHSVNKTFLDTIW